MTTQSSPVITDMKVIPVAGHDSMLLNIGGAHNAYFTRNIVVLTDNAGHTGIGEAPGGEVIYQTLVGAIPMVLGQEVARLNKVVQQVHKGNQAADFDIQLWQSGRRRKCFLLACSLIGKRGASYQMTRRCKVLR